MRCLSVRQPYATLIGVRRKTLEVRSWRTHYRGPLVIVASSRVDRADVASELGERACTTLATGGVTIAVADLVDCRPGRYSDSRRALCGVDGSSYVLELRDARLVDQHPISGRLGLYEADIGGSLAMASLANAHHLRVDGTCVCEDPSIRGVACTTYGPTMERRALAALRAQRPDAVISLHGGVCPRSRETLRGVLASELRAARRAALGVSEVPEIG